ncbi:MAG: hypothetical protein KME13_00545 [Myxacorys californica WJT36-NPBG1]|jgi:hypothetical protein|nr:hypothetical protein [Myxacorys californica WJT36-NPBG1]
MSNEHPNQHDDESLGVEQLPQDELDTSPGDEDVQATHLDVNVAGVATTPADSSKQQDSKS